LDIKNKSVPLLSIIYFFNFYFMNIYVGNLNYRIREDDLKSVMERYGVVDSVKVVKDRETGRSKGFAFVEMQDDDGAKKAIEELNEKEFEGRQMVVKEALPKK
jgi:RNA recognition motif-containing protein